MSFLPIDDIAPDFHAYSCVFLRLMILLLTFMQICQKCSCAKCKGTGPISVSAHSTLPSPRKKENVYWLLNQLPQTYMLQLAFLYSSCCPANKELYARRKIWKPFASCKHEVPSGAAGTYHILQYLETDLISAGLHLSALIHSQIIYISWALPLSMLTAPHLSFSLQSTQYFPASSYFQLNVF